MPEYRTVLGLETSCDETAAAVVVAGKDVRSNIVASQIDLHRKFGGVVPEIASRAHLECFHRIIAEALATAGCTPADIDAIAVTNRPGLVGALLVGVTAAKSLAWAWEKPYIAIDHVQAHAASGAIGLDAPPWPAVALIVSGGHTALYRVDDFDRIALLGTTHDDAAGEAFDKVALMLGLSYPGGPAVEKLAREGNPKAHDFPRTLFGRDSLDFSFSGLKTAVLYAIHGPGCTSGGLEKLTHTQLADLAASFQKAVIDVLVTKTMRAVAQSNAPNVVLGGGVAANKTLRAAVEAACKERNVGFYAPAMAYCIDNGAMIASLGYHLMAKGRQSDWSVDVGTRATV